MDDKINARYTLYVLMVNTKGRMDYYTNSDFSGYTTSEWLLRQNLRNFSTFIQQDDYEIFEYPNVTESQISEIVSEHGLDNENEFILFDGFWGSSFVANFHQLTNVEEASWEDDWIWSSVVTLFFGISIILKSGCINVEEVEPIVKLFNKLIDVYVPIIYLLDSFEYGDEKYFLDLPDDIKCKMTREAEFTVPLETLTLDEVIDLNYVKQVGLESFYDMEVCWEGR